MSSRRSASARAHSQRFEQGRVELGHLVEEENAAMHEREPVHLEAVLDQVGLIRPVLS
jgi:hypothetical protein